MRTLLRRLNESELVGNALAALVVLGILVLAYAAVLGGDTGMHSW